MGEMIHVKKIIGSNTFRYVVTFFGAGQIVLAPMSVNVQAPRPRNAESMETKLSPEAAAKLGVEASWVFGPWRVGDNFFGMRKNITFMP